MKLNQQLVSELNIPAEIDLSNTMKGVGCEQCGRTGYKGRTGIYELLKVNDNIRTAITTRQSAAIIKQIAMQNGMRSLRQDALLKAQSGQSTIEEVVRVTMD